MAARDIHPAEEERDEEESTNRLTPLRMQEEEWLEKPRWKWQRKCVSEQKTKSKMRSPFFSVQSQYGFHVSQTHRNHVTLFVNTHVSRVYLSALWAETVRLFILHHLWQEAAARALMQPSMWQTSHEAVLISCVCVCVCVCFHPLDRMDGLLPFISMAAEL